MSITDALAQSGLSQAEVAEAVGIDRKTVRKRLREAHALIDRLLGQPKPAAGEDGEPKKKRLRRRPPKR